jgi:hypothetical protein
VCCVWLCVRCCVAGCVRAAVVARASWGHGPGSSNRYVHAAYDFSRDKRERECSVVSIV